MEQLKKHMLEKDKVWAVVGASENKDKFGYKIYKRLKERGYEVYPVSPNYETIGGDKCYHTISELPKKPDCVDMVVSPKLTNKIIEDIANAGIKNVWLQPGAFNDETITIAEAKGLDIVYHDCVWAMLAK